VNTWNKEGESLDWKKRVKTMMTELDLFKEFAIGSIDELRNEKIDWQTLRRFAFLKKRHLAWIIQFPRGVLQLQEVHTPP